MFLGFLGIFRWLLGISQVCWLSRIIQGISSVFLCIVGVIYGISRVFLSLYRVFLGLSRFLGFSIDFLGY